MELKVGIVGCGNIAAKHIEALKENNIPLVGGVDISSDVRDRFSKENKVPVFYDTEQMIKEAKPNAVIICTPPSFRIPIVENCLSNKTAVLCEKPLAHKLEDAEKLAEMAQKSDVPCFMGYCHRFVPAVQRIKKLLEENFFGSLISFTNSFGGPTNQMASRWMTDPEISGGGCIIDTASHSIDLFAYLCGKIDKANIFAQHRYAWPKRGDDSGFILTRSEQGTIAQIAASWLFPMPKLEFELIGEKGAVYYDYLRLTELKIRKLGQDDWQTEQVESMADRFKNQIMVFQAAINGEKTELADFQDGLEVSKVTDVIKSQNTGN